MHLSQKFTNYMLKYYYIMYVIPTIAALFPNDVPMVLLVDLDLGEGHAGEQILGDRYQFEPEPAPLAQGGPSTMIFSWPSVNSM